MRAINIIKTLLVLAAIASATGCAVKKDFYSTGGSRADGTVDMAYDFNQFEQPVINQDQARSIAKSKCRVWGYNDAEAFGGRQQICNQFNGYGTCVAGQVVHKYQCIGSISEAPMSQPVATPLSAAPAAPGSLSKGQYQQQQIDQLMQQNLPYEEYQKRHRQIMGE